MFDISDRIEPLELSDVFYRLEELLEQDQFELIFPEYNINMNSKNSRIYHWYI